MSNRRRNAVKKTFVLFANNSIYTIEKMVVLLPKLLKFVIPFVALMLGLYNVDIRVSIPVIILCMISSELMQTYANNVGKGINIPVPEKRFTEVDEYGEVSIESERLEELLLYMSDLEDWLERHVDLKK